MLTLFTVPKGFKGHIGIIQRNAMKSWTQLRPAPEIIIFGDDEGAAEAAQDCKALHVPAIKRNAFGTPLLNDIFQQAETRATHSILCYVNADILLMEDFIGAVQAVRGSLQQFLMVGRRWDVDIRDALDFRVPDWQTSLRDLTKKTNRRRSSEWVDYFAFTRGLGYGLPPFAVGRTCWDNWLIWHARAVGASVVDSSEAVIAVHQNHDYSHHPQGAVGAWHGEEARINLQLSGGRRHHYTINNATHQVTATGRIRRVSLWRNVSAAMEPVWALLFDVFVHRTVRLRHRLGLQRKSWLGFSSRGPIRPIEVDGADRSQNRSRTEPKEAG